MFMSEIINATLTNDAKSNFCVLNVDEYASP